MESSTSITTEMESLIEDGYCEYKEDVYIGKYAIIRKLGSGSSSDVYLCEYNNRKAAIKIVKKKGTCEKRIYREVIISCVLNHPHIVRLIEFLFNDSYYFLVFEYVKGKQLYDLVVKEGFINEENTRRYFRQILSAIDYVHRNSIAHRDLKIENILVDENDNIKIIDFGLSNFFDNKRLLSTFCGSLYFAAPELLMGSRYSGPEVDMWSLGVILYVMLCGCVPFDDDSVHALQNKIKEAYFEIPFSITKSARELLNNMIINKPSLRFTMKEVLKSDWLNEGFNTKVNSFYLQNDTFILDKECIKALESVIDFQFPYLSEEIEDYLKNRKSIFNKRPSISLYKLVLEKEGLKFNLQDNYQSSLSNFVNFILGENSKYFSKNIFKNKTPILNYNWPSIKKSYLRGFFKGIRVKNIGTHNALKKKILDVFNKTEVDYEVKEKFYFCKAYFDSEECLFKVTMYYNVILAEYYLSLTSLNSCKIFKEVFKNIQNTIKS